jgi:TonB family protein
MMAALDNLIAYSLQLAVLAVTAAIVTRVVRLWEPLPSLRFWQAIVAASVLLPLVSQLQGRDGVTGSTTVITAFVSGSSIDAVAIGGAGIARWLLSIAVAGVAFRLAWLGVGLVRLRRITGRAQPTAALDPLLRELSMSLNTTATISITDDVHTPATVGLRRPLILVPRRLLALSQPVQRAVIAHELMHVRRRDWLHTMVEEIWCALLWFHPAARLIASRLALARETVVDEATILLTRDRRAYAEALLAFANPEPHLPGVIALIGRRQLSQRISLIAREDVMTRRRLAVSLSIALLVAGTATSAAVTTFPMVRTAEQATVYAPGDGISLPVVTEEHKPSYTREAMQEKIEGSVWMLVVVGTKGDVTDVTVTTSLDTKYGLDEEAIKAVKRWKFKPGMKDGKPVPVRVTIQMTFTLK